MIADQRALAVIGPLRSRCSVSLDVYSYNHAREIVNWSIVRPCSEYEQWERKGTAEIAETAGIQRWFADTARGKVCNFAFFLLPLGGSFKSFRNICAGHSPSNREK